MALIWYTKFDFVVVVSLNIDKDRKYRYYQGIRGKNNISSPRNAFKSKGS